MCVKRDGARRVQTSAMSLIAALPRSLLRRPLDWFAAEHQRHRQFCHLLSDAADDEVFDGDLLAALLDFLRLDLAQHVLDEEEELFPLLCRRTLPEDEIDRILGLLEAEHEADAGRARAIRTHLERCLAERRAPGADPAVRRDFRAFAAQELQHLALENAVVLPIARLRLAARDLRHLTERLAARRGIVLEAEQA